MEGGELTTPSSKEVLSKPLIDKLLDTAEQVFGGSNFHSYDNYKHYEKSRDFDPQKVRTVPLPEEFKSLTLGDLGINNIVYYLDNPNHKASSTFTDEECETLGIKREDVLGEKSVGISSHTTQNNGKEGFLREVTYHKVGQFYFQEVNVYLNGEFRVFGGLSESKNFNDKPYGLYEARYILNPDGSRTLRDITGARIDEVVTPDGPVRFSRQTHQTTNALHPDLPHYYQEVYFNKKTGKRAEVKIYFSGDGHSPEDVVVLVGHNMYDASRKPKILAKSMLGGVRILIQDGEEEALEWLSKDPSFDFLAKRRANKRELREFLKSRVTELENSFFAPENIFVNPAQLSAAKLIT